jgi:hypothetical protein
MWTVVDGYERGKLMWMVVSVGRSVSEVFVPVSPMLLLDAAAVVVTVTPMLLWAMMLHCLYFVLV